MLEGDAQALELEFQRDLAATRPCIEHGAVVAAVREAVILMKASWAPLASLGRQMSRFRLFTGEPPFG